MNQIWLASGFLLFTIFTIYADKPFNGYYITLQNDTVKTTILYKDIIDLQHKLVVSDADNVQTTFYPGDIRGFYMQLNNSFEYLDLKNRTSWHEVRQVNLHSIPAQTDYFHLAKPSELYFESLAINTTTKLFVSIKYGNGGDLKVLEYFYVLGHHTEYSWPYARLLSTTLLEDHTGLVTKKWKESLKYVFAHSVSDYSLLAQIIKEGRLNPRHVRLIVNEYNDWKQLSPQSKADTSLAIHGILDANKYYKTKKFFWINTAGISAFVFPGLVTNIILKYHKIKPENLHFPVNCSYCTDKKYVENYKIAANDKQCKSLERGFFAGIAVYLALVVPIVASISR